MASVVDLVGLAVVAHVVETEAAIVNDAVFIQSPSFSLINQVAAGVAELGIVKSRVVVLTFHNGIQI
jgi:hypothetical protein